MGGELRRTFFNLFNMGEIIGHGEILDISNGGTTYTLVTPETLSNYTNHAFIIYLDNYKYISDKATNGYMVYKP